MQIKGLDDIAKLSLPERLGIFIVILALGAVGFYFGVYQDRSDELENLEIKHGRLKKELVKFKAKHANYIRDIEELNRRRTRQKEQLRILPPHTEISSFLNDINNLGELCGLKITKVVPKREIGHGFYAEIPIALNIHGTFHQITKFFFGVGQLERIINLEDISIGSPKLNEGDVILRVKVRATTFRSLERKNS